MLRQVIRLVSKAPPVILTKKNCYYQLSSQTTVDDEVSFALLAIRRGPKRLRLPPLSRPSLRTSGRIKIGQLKKYLVTKLSLSDDKIMREVRVSPKFSKIFD
jgi:hypothetical protein